MVRPQPAARQADIEAALFRMDERLADMEEHFERHSGVPVAVSDTLKDVRDFRHRTTTNFTIVDLHLFKIDHRLVGIDTHLTGIDARLDGVDTHLTGLRTRLDGIDTRLDGVDSRLDGIDGRLGNVESLLVKIADKLEVMPPHQQDPSPN